MLAGRPRFLAQMAELRKAVGPVAVACLRAAEAREALNRRIADKHRRKVAA